MRSHYHIRGTMVSLLAYSSLLLWTVQMTSAMAGTHVSPGLNLTLSQTGLQYAASVAIDQISSEVQGQSIPDQHGKEGKFDYDITGMRVTGFTRPSSSLTVNPGHGITWSLQGAGASVHGDWRYKFKKIITIRDHGSFDVSASGISLTVSIAMGVDTSGRPTVSSQSCSCSVSDVNVKFHGGASWLYNLFRHTLEKPIRHQLQTILCKSVNKALNVDASAALAKMKVEVPIGKLFMLDYRLVAAPIFGAQFVESEHKGEFEWRASPSTPPFQPPGITVPRSNQKMVTICVSDYTMNTLGYVAHTHGLLKYTLTKSDLPDDKKAFLNTKCASGTCIGSFLPQLGRNFPEGSVELNMQTNSPPTVNTTSDVITANFRGQIAFNVREPNGTLNHAFTADLETALPLSVAMSNAHVTAHVSSFRFNVTKTQSDIGPIPETVLGFAFNLAAKSMIIPNLNKLGAQGIDLPSIDHVEFVDPSIQLLQGAVCFATDARYDPSLRFQPHSDRPSFISKI